MLLVNLDGHHDEWSHLIPRWRATDGLVNFLWGGGGGGASRTLFMIFLAVAGTVIFLANRFPSVHSIEHDPDIDYSDSDEFIYQEVEWSTVLGLLLN